jgi:hypothetical protein
MIETSGGERQANYYHKIIIGGGQAGLSVGYGHAQVINSFIVPNANIGLEMPGVIEGMGSTGYRLRVRNMRLSLQDHALCPN